MKLFVDTCVWRYWFSYKNGHRFSKLTFEKYAKDFDQIYQIVAYAPPNHMILYNALIEKELASLSKLFNEVIGNRFMEKIPIPLSRADGTYNFGGSLLGGGNFGGTLKCILSTDGHDHEKAYNDATPDFEKDNPAHHKTRIKEFDVEHLESAIEANADMFITTDDPLIRRLKRAKEQFSDNPVIMTANVICVTPSQALQRIKGYNGNLWGGQYEMH